MRLTELPAVENWLSLCSQLVGSTVCLLCQAALIAGRRQWAPDQRHGPAQGLALL